MKKCNNLVSPVFLIFSAFLFFSCSSFKIENVTYGWSAEVFFNPDDAGNISIPKNSMSFNVSQILTEEKLSDKPSSFKIRVIRDDAGYFFITADKFKYVWIFETAEKSLKLVNKIELVKDNALADPKFNEHRPNVEIFTKDGKKYILDKDGIMKNEENKNEK